MRSIEYFKKTCSITPRLRTPISSTELRCHRDQKGAKRRVCLLYLVATQRLHLSEILAIAYFRIPSAPDPACFSKLAIRFSNLETWFWVEIAEKKKAMGRNAINAGKPPGMEMVLLLQPYRARPLIAIEYTKGIHRLEYFSEFFMFPPFCMPQGLLAWQFSIHDWTLPQS